MADKRKRGRPRNDPPTRQRSLFLTDEQCRLLRMWGRGDMSAAVRWLIDNAVLVIRRVEVKA